MKHIIFILLSIIIILSCEKDKQTDLHPDANNRSVDTIDHDSLWMSYTGYIPFPEGDAEWITEGSDAIWVNGQVHQNQPPDTIILFYNKFYFSGDTVIDNVKYKKIIRNYQYKKYDFDAAYIYPGHLVDEGTKSEIYGFFR